MITRTVGPFSISIYGRNIYGRMPSEFYVKMPSTAVDGRYMWEFFIVVGNVAMALFVDLFDPILPPPSCN